MKLDDLLALLKATYTGPIGAEFMHITDSEQRRWLYERMEAAGGDFGQTGDEKRRILERLTAAEGLERYLHTKYVGQKRFSLEAGDSGSEPCRESVCQSVYTSVVAVEFKKKINTYKHTN